MKEEADKKDEIKKENLDKILDESSKWGYFKRLVSYNKPFSLVLIAVLCSALQGCVYPVYGWFFVKILFAQLSLNLPVENDPFKDV